MALRSVLLMIALYATGCGALNMVPARLWGRLSSRLAASTITEPRGAFDQWTNKKTTVLDEKLLAQSMQGYVDNILSENDKAHESLAPYSVALNAGASTAAARVAAVYARFESRSGHPAARITAGVVAHATSAAVTTPHYKPTAADEAATVGSPADALAGAMLCGAVILARAPTARALMLHGARGGALPLLRPALLVSGMGGVLALAWGQAIALRWALLLARS